MNGTLALLLALAAAAPPPARTYIDVGSPDFRPLALAITPPQASPDVQPQANEVGQAVRDDLALTGIFDLLDPRSFLADAREGTAAAQIRFARWADVGAEGLVKVLVRRDGPGLSADLHLYDVRAGREVLFQVLRGAPPRPPPDRRPDRAVVHAGARDLPDPDRGAAPLPRRARARAPRRRRAGAGGRLPGERHRAAPRLAPRR